jgi:hypothetical protein
MNKTGYINYLENNGLSLFSIISYVNYTEYFLTWIKTYCGYEICEEEIEPNDLWDFLKYLKSRGLKKKIVVYGFWL